MRIIKGIEFIKVDNKVIAVTTGDATTIYKGIINLNESAYTIWKLFEKGLDFKEAANQLTKEYDELTFEEAYKYVEEFGNKLIEKGILIKN